MKKLIIILLLLPFCAGAQLISQFPNAPYPRSTYLFVMEQPGVTNWNITLSQLETTTYNDLGLSLYNFAFSPRFLLRGITNVDLAYGSIDYTNLDSTVGLYCLTNTLAVATNALLTFNALSGATNVGINAQAVATNIVMTLSNSIYTVPLITNGIFIFESGTNIVPVNMSYVWIAATNNQPGKIFVGSNGVWFPK